MLFGVKSIYSLFFSFCIRDSIMAFITDRPNQKRKRHCCSIFAHISRHNCIKAANRRRCCQRIEQICTTGPIGHTKSISISAAVFITPSSYKIRIYQTVKSWTCKSSHISNTSGHISINENLLFAHNSH